MNLHDARKIAEEYCWKIKPFCEEGKLKIAGSILRRKAEPKDIEIVCISKKQEIKDLFGSKTGEIKDSSFIHSVMAFGNVIKGTPTGKYMKIELPEGIMLDLFMPAPEDFFRILVIRTGSAEYVRKIVAPAWKKKGWCGSDKGLRKMIDCVEMKDLEGKSKWKCVNKHAELPPVWESDKHFFKWLGVEYIEPWEREVENKSLLNYLSK